MARGRGYSRVAPSVQTHRHAEARKSSLPPPAVFGFLLPNFLGFLAFTIFPVVFSFVMVFTNWTIKPAVEFEFVGLRNVADLLGVRAVGEGSAVVWLFYVAAAVLLVAGLIGALWANVSGWRGARMGGAILGATGFWCSVRGVAPGGHHSLILAGGLLLLCGIASARREDQDFVFGRGTVPAILLAAGALGLWLLGVAMWKAYEPRDARFWHYFYNTLYLMLAMPFSIAGSLALALLVNDEIPTGERRFRAIQAVICLACGAVTALVFWGAGNPNLAFLGGIFWLVAALGVGFGIVAYRTLYYIPKFTAGVALFILWKALYNPETGPVNAAISFVFNLFGIDAEAPAWLAIVTWAKPAMMFMGFWIAVGGMNMILYLAALSNLPQDLLDAAAVDGAGAWARFRHVIWPQLAPTTFFIVVMSTIGGLQGGFEQARVMTQGGPAGSTTTLSYYIYNKGFEDLDLGYAAAISWVLFAIIFIATAINWKFGKELEVEP